ncbi:hypothetical protein HNR46_002181 [Haloferula luteola]|uniref:Uncharacterized protein n=1 Tax=Haloferula luteola TaxID=595692 RepID=A0A840V1S5_9BACT|nr:hypothetical protein [Haloferula luteola]MBB5351942.1 hypothetical protein [Haloferula luteola]
MKTIATSFLAGLTLMSASGAQGMRDSATHEELAGRLRAQQQKNPMRVLPAGEGEDPSKTNRPADILEDSDIFTFSGESSLVPKGAVLAVPAAFQSRLGASQTGKFIPWSRFLAENRGWIEVVDLSLEQIVGEEPLPADLVKRMETCQRVLVAAVQGGPITVPAAKIDAAREAAKEGR